jgi:hypothetical protein
MWRFGRTFPRQISVDQAVTVEFRKKRVLESRARGAETLRRKRYAAWAKPELPLRSECHWVNAISCTISTPIFYEITFYIEREKGL